MPHLDDLPIMTDIERANYDARQARINPSAERLLGLYFPVLDHGFVSLVDYCGGDFSIVRAARTSYQHGVGKRTDDRNIIRYLLRHDHGSPFEFVQFTFHCQLPIFVARQWIRHRISSFNEMSGRYSILPLMFYTPREEDLKTQSLGNKQGRDGELTKEAIQAFYAGSQQVRQYASEMYESAISDDVARELARIDLPLSTYTNWYWSVNLRSLMNFMTLRCDSHSQWEIRQYANTIAGIVQQVVPEAFEAWIDYEYCSHKLSRQELQLLPVYEQVERNETIEETAAKLGMSKREIKEFFDNISGGEKPDFTLDMAKAKTPQYFSTQAEQYIPSQGE